MIGFAANILDRNCSRVGDIAVIDHNGSREVSWKQLRQMVFKVASYATEQGLKGIVPVCMDRGAEAVATVLGLNFAGIAPAALSIDTPEERLKNIAAQTGNELWTIDTCNKAWNLKDKEDSPFRADNIVNTDYEELDQAIWGGRELDPGYVLFTSGSTGSPKGVLLDNAAVMGGIERAAGPDFFDFQPGDRVLQMGSFSFVVYLTDMLAPLYCGCETHVFPESARGDNSLTADYVNAYSITHLMLPPQLYRTFDCPDTLRCVCVGGDRIINLSPKGHTRLVSVYGMSEMAGFAFHYEVTKAEPNTPIGKASHGITAYILDDEGKLCEEGELCVSGPVSRGYLNLPELSARIFTPNPFSDEPGQETLLHTGDLVRTLPDGNLLFLCRKDRLLKVNGQRTEPEEIELAMCAFPGIREAAVQGITDSEGSTILCGYYTADQPIDEDSLKQHLETRLNHYMVPSLFRKLESMPLNSHGKLDRNSLPIPDFSISAEEYVAPSSELEATICEGFAKALHLEKVGALDDFLLLGGDSIRALGVVYVCKDYGLTIADVLKERTPRAIARCLEDRGVDPYAYKYEKQDRVRLTDSQAGIFLDCLLQPESKMFNLPVHITLNSRRTLSLDEVAAAVNKVFRAHPALYSYMETEQDQAFMVRDTYPKNGLCRIIRKEVSQERLQDILEHFSQPISLFEGPLCRAEVYLCEGTVHVLMEIHHIVADGTSLKIILKQLTEALDGKNPPEEQFDSFALKQVERREWESPAHTRAVSYYDQLLGGVETDSNLIADYSSKETGLGNLKRLDFPFASKPVLEKLKSVSFTENTLFMSAFGYTLAKMTGQSESLFMVAESGRESSIVDTTVSMMVKTLPVVMRLEQEEKSGKELLTEIQDQFFDSMRNDCVSIRRLRNKFNLATDVDFVYQGDAPCYTSGDISTDTVMLDTGDARCNLAVSLFRRGDRFLLRIEYRKDLYRASTIKRFARLFRAAVNNLLSDKPLKKIPLVSGKDLGLLRSFNETALAYDASQTFVDQFRGIVNKALHKIAVIYQDHKYTYEEVDEISDNIAGFLRSKGIGKGDAVGVLIPRCEYIAIASIGIIKAGACYEPLDPSYPKERLTYMHKDAGVRLVIADRDLIGLLPEYKGEVLYTDEIPTLPVVKREEVLPLKPAPEDVYILLYTSGTSGTPKGCMLTHKNLAAFIIGHTEKMHITPDSILMLYASYGFDAHMADLYPALANGCELHIIPDDLRLDFPSLKKYMEDNAITHATMTTQVARQFIAEYREVKHLRYLGTGGEKLTSFEPRHSYQVMNLYGPTETTIAVTGFTVDQYYESIPIGRPFANTHLYVVDSCLRPVPVGVPGELLISGPQVSNGYLHQKELTDRVFIPNTYESDPRYPICYRTGDVVRYLENGNLLYMGRRDLQVKIRGFRIELEEVAQVIRSFPGITDVAVITVDDQEGKSIHAYIVGEEPINIQALTHYIRSKKPAYMVPAGILQIDKIPLTVNQKVDRRALPAIPKTKANEAENTRAMTDLEASLVDILREVAGDGNYGVQTAFADMGITSISSLRLAGRIYKQFGYTVNARELLGGADILSVENSVVADLLKARMNPPETVIDAPVLKSYPLTQTQMGIYLDCQRIGMEAYNVPMLFRLPAGTSVPRLKIAIETAVRNHPSMLCTIRPDENGDVAVYPKPDLPIPVEELKQPQLQVNLADFSFTDQPLFHFSVHTCDDGQYLFIQIHHIISDGESMTILLEDLDRAYRDEALEKERISAMDLSLAEQAARSTSAYQAAKNAYDSIFQGISSDYVPARDNQEEDKFEICKIPIHADTSAVEELCRYAGVTPNTFFTAVFALTLARYTYHDDALFTTIYNGRTDPRTERLVSMLVKTLPVYISADPIVSVRRFLIEVQNRLHTVRAHDLFSFGDAVREYGVSDEVMFIYQGKLLSEPKFNGEIVKMLPVPLPTPKTPISAEVYEEKEGFSLTIEYNAGHYTKAFMDGFAHAFDTCASSLLHCRTIGEVSLTSDAVLSRYARFNDTAIPVPFYPMGRRFTLYARENPGKIAVIASPENSREFTSSGTRPYDILSCAQLDNLSGAVAKELIKAGIQPGDIVGVMTGRTKEIYVGQLGILKAGCPFVFLSPTYPPERLRYICEDASVKAVVTTHHQANTQEEFFKRLSLPVVYADDFDKDVPVDCPMVDRTPQDVAYIIYTSGSTGTPKGIQITHKGINNLADNNEKNLQIKDLLTDSMCAVAAFTFDASILDGYVALTNGATVSIASEDDIHDPVGFCSLCTDQKVKSFVGTPSFVLSLLDCPEFKTLAKHLEAICCGGEVYPPALYEKLKALNPHIRLLNGYGPAETTVDCTAKLLDSPKTIDIGTPINNVGIYILDRQNHVLPMGALGELTITGDGVGLGYLNREELTKKSFISLLNQPAYKSGDLAVISPAGSVSFRGRTDNQVKLRGLRVELGEIENAINRYPSVQSSVVIVRGKEGTQYLAAYYTADKEVEWESIRDELKKTLPEYMVPGVWMQLSELPLTANGKINKLALPELIPDTAKEQRDYTAPSNPVEEALCLAFAQALGLEQVGATEDFFALGGTSLTATKVAMFARAHNIAIAYKDIFAHPTARELSALAGEVNKEEPKIEPLAEPEAESFKQTAEPLSGNVWNMGDKIGYRPLGNVLLTGATGFLGMHMLKTFLDQESGEVTCLMKKGSFTSTELRLKGMYYYYFEQSLDPLLGKRVHCVEGDITDPDCLDSLRHAPIDTVINCAACVKHFVSGDILQKVNVKGVENLVNYCRKKGNRLIQISTVSVAGESVNGVPEESTLLKENMLYFGQELENAYIRSKFDAEKLVLDACAKGLDAKIMRCGNLMPRYSDGEFQINYLTNGFMRQLRGYHALGCIPYSALAGALEFSPIDDVAKVILSLCKTDSRYTVFHTLNNHKVFMADVIEAMNKAGLKVECVPEEVFAKKLTDAMNDMDLSDDVGGLIAYLNRDNRKKRVLLDNDSTFTGNVLVRTGTIWNITGQDYLVNAFRKLSDLGFFTLPRREK